jgi:hypothetical protein
VPAPRRTRRTAGPRPHARLPEAGVAPSQGPMPEAAPTPRHLGARVVAWRAPRSTRRDCRVCSRPPAGTRPSSRPWWFRDVVSVAYKGPDRPRACALESPSPRVRHRVPWAPPPVTEAAAPSYDPVASPTPRLDPVEAQTSPCCAAVPRTSPERAPPRPPPPSAAG